MKKHILVFFIWACYCSLYGQTNKYYDAYENWSQTSYGMTMGQPWTINARYLYINGDTIMNGKIFKKLFYLYRDSNVGGFGPTLGSSSDPTFLIKEENDTIIVLSILSADLLTDTTFIYYNFQDSFIYERIHITDSGPQIYESTYAIYGYSDSIRINNVTRRIMNVTNGQTYEGAIGNSWGAMVSAITDPGQFDGYQILQCYGGNDSTYINYGGEIWPGFPNVLLNPVWGNCNIDNVYYSAVENLADLNIIVYPNPSSAEIRISSSNGKEIEEIIAYSYSGQNQLLNSSDINTWNVSDLLSGIYILKIKMENNIIYRKFVKE